MIKVSRTPTCLETKAVNQRRKRTGERGDYRKASLSGKMEQELTYVLKHSTQYSVLVKQGSRSYEGHSSQ